MTDTVSLPRYGYLIDMIYFPAPTTGLKGHRFELTMSAPTNHMGYRYPELHAGCTGCAACLLVCPDFVFEVYRFDTPHKDEVPPPPEAPHA